MAYTIKLVKLINGEMVMGKLSDDGDKLTDVAVLQTVPTQQGVQMMLMPYGYPFEQDMDGEIEMKHVLYDYKKLPDELEKKYMEASSNLTLSTPSDLNNLTKMASGGNVSDLSQLLKK